MAKNKKRRQTSSKAMEKIAFAPIEPKDYSIARNVEKITEKLYQAETENIRELRTKQPRYYELLDADNVRRKRRQAATLRTVDTVRALVSDVCPDIEPRFYIVEEWARINAAGINSYDMMESTSHLMLGAAIWMLDRIRENGGWLQLMHLLPMDDEALDEIEMPELYDLCYGEELLREMLYVIQKRNSDCTGLRLKKGKTQAKEHVFMDDYTAAGKQRQDVTSRQRFEAIMALIDEDAKRTATAHFEEKLWDWVRRYFMARADSARREGVYARKYNAFAKKAAKGIAEIHERRKNVAPKRETAAPKVAFPMAVPAQNSPLPSPQKLASRRDSLNFTMELIAESERLDDMEEALDDEIRALMFNTNYHGSIRRDTLEEEIGAYAAEQIGGFTIDDPYEMCFALLALIDEDSDLPWLYYPGTAIMRSAAGYLPWYFNDFEDDNEFWPELWNEDDAELYGSEAWIAAAKKQQAPELLDWYTPKYLLRTGREEMQERKNLAQIVYRLTGCIPPRKEHRYDGALATLSRYGITGKKTLVPLLHCLSMMGEARHQWQDMRDYMPAAIEEDEQETEESGETIDPEVYREMIQRLKAENDQLKKSLHDAGREAREAKRKLEAQSEIWEQERQELQDFRELFFRQGQDEEPAGEQADEDISYPYTTKKRTVVFGGHDTWTKAIKPMLPEVRFVGRESIPNPDMIRHADVVWIQSNALAHKHYYKIIDVTRTYHIPVRYFGYASAEKCARQLIAEDDK